MWVRHAWGTLPNGVKNLYELLFGLVLNSKNLYKLLTAVKKYSTLYLDIVQ